jgi:hypothetical protein
MSDILKDPAENEVQLNRAHWQIGLCTADKPGNLHRETPGRYQFAFIDRARLGTLFSDTGNRPRARAKAISELQIKLKVYLIASAGAPGL